MKYIFKDTTTTEYTIEADSEEEAVAMLDKLVNYYYCRSTKQFKLP